MKKSLHLLLLGLLIVVLLTACSTPLETSVPAGEEPTVSEENTEDPTPEPEATATNTPEPEKVLVVCLGNEPETLFLYGGASSAMWSVLEAIYDGPFDLVDGELQTTILTQVPTVDNGAITFSLVDTSEGQLVVDASGSLVALQPGTMVLPAGCTNSSCAVEWQPASGIDMETMSVQFELQDGLTWSDGVPLTSADSEFSFSIGQLKGLPVSSMVYDRTIEYAVTSDTGLRWTGIPGYFPRDVSTLFAIPQPAHLLKGMDVSQLLAQELPLGWGAYVLTEWVHGDHITLVRNEHYHRSDEGLPAFDRLVFRFPSDVSADFLSALLVGECDVVDRTAGLAEVVQSVRIAEIEGKVNLHVDQGPDWTQLVFGINPASYDDGYNFYQDERVNYFNDPLTRKGIAACLDRNEYIRRFFIDLVTIPESYLVPDHPLFLQGQTPVTYDPEQGKAWLEAAGWRDFGGETRVSYGVDGVMDGTPLIIDLSMVQAADRELSDDLLSYFSAKLRACGLGVNPLSLEPIDLYAPGPDGRIFGRNFDLAQITWLAGNEPPCSLYMTDQIPNAQNFWIGANVGGYSNPEFDQACQ
ncbi:MAG: ABC transporter substrate-binding protein, partial [Anaerolineae bacterium]|nr:ABC transporter substrate-binding protein [Anaerolineae bacterium]